MAKSTYRIINCRLDELEPSPYQPTSRTEHSNSLNHLQNSIKTVGLQYPPLVVAAPGGKYVIVDGHRRFKVAENLGWPSISVLCTEGHGDELFAHVSGNVAKMRASDWVSVHLKGGALPSGPTKTCIYSLEKAMGKEFLEKIRDRGISPSVWHLSNKILRYIAADETERASILNWLVMDSGPNKKSLSQQVSAFINGGNSAKELRAAIQEGRPPH